MSSIMKVIILALLVAVSFTVNAFAQNSRQVHQKRSGSTAIGFNYFEGDKVKTGYGIQYLSLNREEESRFELGYGFALNYFDVENKDDNLTGSFIGYSPQFALNLYANEGPLQFVLGARILIVFGSETINSTVTNYFIGPQFKETAGILILNTMHLNAGAFQLYHFGSDLLPSDSGLVMGLDVIF